MTNDKQRDRLVELLQESTKHVASKTMMGTCEERIAALEKISELRADYLLANGVIVPPCKVGQTVYCNIEGFDKPLKGMIRRISISKDFVTFSTGIDGYFPQDYLIQDFGKTVFPTKEEALAKLKEGVE